jgi:hypothetical protein
MTWAAHHTDVLQAMLKLGKIEAVSGIVGKDFKVHRHFPSAMMVYMQKKYVSQPNLVTFYSTTFATDLP